MGETWKDTSIGKIYRQFVNAHASAWIKDTEYGFRDGWGPSQSVDRAWKKFRELETEFETALAALIEHQPTETADTPTAEMEDGR